MAASPAPQVLDGRHARSLRARAAIVDAYLSLLDDGELRPSAARVAARAGVSLRSVFQHFSDVETLFAAVAERQTTRIGRMLTPLPTDGPVAPRLAAFVAQRAAVLEMITPVRRAAILTEPFSREIRERLRTFRGVKAAQVRKVFAPELAACRGARRRALAGALVAASSWSFWENVRAHQGLTARQARGVVHATLAALLGVAPEPHRR